MGAKVALVWRGDREMRRTATSENNRLRHIFEALAAEGIDAAPAVFDEEFLEEVRAQLFGVDGVLVWVDPLSEGKVRTALDSLLRELAEKGIWVSAHPDVILKMGTKEILYRTKHLGWGTDTHLYRTRENFRAEFPQRLRTAGPRVLKQNRGNGGQGVWKVELLSDASHGSAGVRVLHAKRGSAPEDIPLAEFVAGCEAYFDMPDGCIVDQPFQARLPEGMIRCYVSANKVAGYGHQLIKALIPPPREGPDSPEAQPGPRIMHEPDAPQFLRLRTLVETDWIPQMMKTLDIGPDKLPAIWDADFLYGPRDSSGDDTYVLCEINVSSVFPIPEQAPQRVAQHVGTRLLR